MVVNRLSSPEDTEAPSSKVEQFSLNEDTKYSVLDQHNEENLATKWEIWAYYTYVVYFSFQASD